MKPSLCVGQDNDFSIYRLFYIIFPLRKVNTKIKILNAKILYYTVCISQITFAKKSQLDDRSFE